jgi:hypothetical protein
MGCCVDKACTAETCMNLPEGLTCSDCFHVRRCTGIFGAKETDTACQFFPRRFHNRYQTVSSDEKHEESAYVPDEPYYRED